MNPPGLEAGLGWIVGWDKPDFIGRDALRREKADGVARKIVGFEMIDKGIGQCQSESAETSSSFPR